MADKLKSCPFCGGAGKYHGTYDEEYDEDGVCEYVSCTRCNASTPLMDKKGESIEWWNRRANPWHTGTPTEDGMYVLYFWDGSYDFEGIENGKFECLNEREAEGIVAYMPITPYEGEVTNG